MALDNATKTKEQIELELRRLEQEFDHPDVRSVADTRRRAHSASLSTLNRLPTIISDGP